MYDFERNLKKLQDEGLVVFDGNELAIHGDIWCGSSVEPVYGGGIKIPYFNITFKRSGRKQDIELNLEDILEYFGFGFGKVTIKVEKVKGEG